MKPHYIMKYIKTFELHSAMTIDSYLKKSTFDDLPLDFKKGLMTWMVEGDPVEWTFDGVVTDWINDNDVINDVIADYSREKGNQEFTFGFVPTDLIIEKLTPIIIDELGYDSFEEWHQAYQSTNPSNHGDSLFPIIVDDQWEEWIQDGWHRFNYYLSKNLKTIPVIKL